MQRDRDPLRYARHGRSRFLAELADFIRFPSVSAQPKHARDIRACAEWLASHLQGIGMQRISIIATAGHPLVFAEWRGNPSLCNVLIYGHYDVQPPEPMKEWLSPPFSPIVRGADLYGRGASDDKGQMFIHVKALESYLQTQGYLPVNVACLFEGEEEIGSPGLQRFLETQHRRLHADVAVVSDMPMPAPGKPAITYAMRGGLSFELQVNGPAKDLHSGLYGGAVYNPLQALAEIVTKLHDSRGRVTVPGFYDRVRLWSHGEREQMGRDGPTDAQLLKQAQTAKPWGESGFSEYERTTIRPAFTVNGISGGYQGSGTKGVIPAAATAKLSFRLAPDQDPHEIEHLTRQHIARLTPKAVTSRIRVQSHARPVVLSRNHPFIQAAAFALQKGFGNPPVFLRSGGTIPVVAAFQRTLNIPTVLMGFALPDDRMHAPNEKFHLPNFHAGIDSSIWFLRAIGQLQRMERTDRHEQRLPNHRLSLSRR